MAVFRVQEHSPDVYPRKSRDYQLYSVLFDCLYDGIKYDIDSVRDVIDTNQCNERRIPYLQTKLGFFTKLKIPTDKLRTILKAFPRIIKYKGSLRGVEEAVQVFLKVENIDTNVEVRINNDDIEPYYTVIIELGTRVDDFRILVEILKYILPAGYALSFVYHISEGGIRTNVDYADSIRLVSADASVTNSVRVTAEEFNDLPNVLNNVGLVEISEKTTKPDKELNADEKIMGQTKTLRRVDLWH